MKKIIMVIFLSFPLAIFSSTLVILECELLEGGTIEDVKRINSAWVKSVNELNDKKKQAESIQHIINIIDLTQDPESKIWALTVAAIASSST